MTLLDIVVQAALQYEAATMNFGPHANYDAELELRQDNLERAMRDWAKEDAYDEPAHDAYWANVEEFPTP